MHPSAINAIPKVSSKAVQRIELVQMPQEQALHDDAQQPHGERRENEGTPVIDAEELQADIRCERTPSM